MLRANPAGSFYPRYIVGNMIIDAITAFWVVAGWQEPGTWVMTVDRNFGVLGRYTTWPERSFILSLAMLLVVVGACWGWRLPFCLARIVQGGWFVYLGAISYRVHSTGTIYIVIGIAALALAYQSWRFITLARLVVLATAQHDETMTALRHNGVIGEEGAVQAAGAYREAREISRSMGNEGWDDARR